MIGLIFKFNFNKILSMSIWSKFRLVHCMPNDCFCEGIRDGLIAQPSATLTMLPLLLLGFYILVKSSKSKNLFPRLLGISTVVAGLGSMIFHGTMTHFGATLDWLGIYMIILTFFLWGANNLVKLTKKTTILSFLGFVVSFTIISYFFMTWGRTILGILLTLTLLEEILILLSNKRILGNLKYYFLTIVLFLSAFFLHQLDERRIICNPSSLFQLHSIWHILIVLAVYCYYIYNLSRYYNKQLI